MSEFSARKRQVANAAGPFFTATFQLKLVIAPVAQPIRLSNFYRQEDGNIESFTAKMIVSDSDLDPVAPGVQNVWIQGIGCATGAITSFN